MLCLLPRETLGKFHSFSILFILFLVFFSSIGSKELLRIPDSPFVGGKNKQRCPLYTRVLISSLFDSDENRSREHLFCLSLIR